MKVKVSEASGVQLDWMAAFALGYTMREPVSGTNEEARKLTTPFDMFEVNYEQTAQGETVRAWVSPIAVTRFGIDHSVGATAESLDFTDSEGRHARSSIGMFYFDPAEAALEVNGAMVGYAEGFSPSTNWGQGGPIIEREFIELAIMPCWQSKTQVVFDMWLASTARHDEDRMEISGPTPLIAAMRCFVASKLVDEVEIPEIHIWS